MDPAPLHHSSSEPLYDDAEAGPSLREAGRQLSEPLPQARPGRALSGNDRQRHRPTTKKPTMPVLDRGDSELSEAATESDGKARQAGSDDAALPSQCRRCLPRRRYAGTHRPTGPRRGRSPIARIHGVCTVSNWTVAAASAHKALTSTGTCPARDMSRAPRERNWCLLVLVQ